MGVALRFCWRKATKSATVAKFRWLLGRGCINLPPEASRKMELSGLERQFGQELDGDEKAASPASCPSDGTAIKSTATSAVQAWRGIGPLLFLPHISEGRC